MFQQFQIVKDLRGPIVGSRGFLSAQNAKTPAVRSVAPTGVLVDPREVPVCIQVTSRKCPEEVTSYHSLSSYRDGNRA